MKMPIRGISMEKCSTCLQPDWVLTIPLAFMIYVCVCLCAFGHFLTASRMEALRENGFALRSTISPYFQKVAQCPPDP